MLQIILAFLATVLTAVQSLLIYTEGKGICLGSGCEIVERLTTVSPLYFNMSGALYFFVIFWCLYFGRHGSDFWGIFARLMLLAGLVAEAVLVFFQYSIANVFCYYCLCILGFIILLNVLGGIRQILRGGILAGSVLLACFSLDFGSGNAAKSSLDNGAIAAISGDKSRPSLRLFFSKTCVYCEKVIDSLKEGTSCSITFNPVEKIDAFSFPEAENNSHYDHTANLVFLRSLSLTTIPVLVAERENTISVISGGSSIMEFLSNNCALQTGEGGGSSDISSNEENGYTRFLGTSNQADENCNVAEDCPAEEPLSSPGVLKKQ